MAAATPAKSTRPPLPLLESSAERTTEGAGVAVAVPCAVIVTVAVRPEDATRLVHGIQTGRLYAVLNKRLANTHYYEQST